ncbi:TPA: hypothetical protein DEO28_03390 [Candidatus Dependentiae bacterium]|nr:MAG: Intracellular protease, PfpI family [candidate division TM6 bacterium GW2011_GWF2_33_332]HBS48101.1 hypothetical protein [Candidatus Dependentiae bacterium]HBZ73525.1 hypothetical protein [Candidatus Dependentiae bacterium]
MVLNKKVLFLSILSIVVIIFLSFRGENVKKRALFILMPQDFQDLEFLEPYKILKEGGIEIDVAGLKPGIAKGMFGRTFEPNLLLDDLNNEKFDVYDALVIPGGSGSTEFLWEDLKVLETIKYFHSKNKIVAAICHACAAVANSRILTGKEATVFPSDEALDVFKKNEVKFVDKGVVISQKDKIITSQGPKFAREFGNAILSMLKK